MGCKVDVACYSQYLRQRDGDYMKELLSGFDELNLNENINYGTIGDLCKNMINKDFNLQNEIKSLIEENKPIS